MATQLNSSTLNRRWRWFTNHLATVLAVASTILVVAPLIAIFIDLVVKGTSSLNLNFFTKIPAPVGEQGGGMANAIVGSAVLLGLASLLGIPIGIAAGIYLSEYGRGSKLSNVVRFTADVLNGVPSIVMGVAVYALVVVPAKGYSAFAGGVALGIMMIPTVARTTEEMLLMVPHSIREAALGLGVPNWRSMISITLKTAMPGVITGCMLAFARVIVRKPDLVLLDEPTQGLSPIYVGMILEYIRRLRAAGVTVILVEQALDAVAAVSDTVYVMSDGRVRAQLDPSQLDENEELLARHLHIRHHAEPGGDPGHGHRQVVDPVIEFDVEL